MWAGHKERRVGAGLRNRFAESKPAANRRVHAAPASRHGPGRGGFEEARPKKAFLQNEPKTKKSEVIDNEALM
jgi:hypothetical protein